MSSVKLLALEGDNARIDDAGGTRMSRIVAGRREGADLPNLPPKNFVLLTNGDRIPLDPDASANLKDSRLHVWPTTSLPDLRNKGMSFYVPNVVLLFWSLPEGITDAELFFARLERETRRRDTVYLTNGDHLEGSITAMTPKEGVSTASNGRTIVTPWSKVAGVAWNTDRQARLRTKRAYWRAALDGGARVNLLDLRFDEKTRRWNGTTQFGPALDLPESAVLALDLRQSSAVDLADLTPARYEHQPYLGVSWPLAKDDCVTGHPLRLGRSTYERGLGMHAPSRVTYALEGKYQRFTAQVGIDDRARRGRARVAIEIDGKRLDLNDGKELTATSSPLNVGIDVQKARTLTLIVELGAFGDVQAHVDWANARLIKSDKTP